MPKTFTLTLIFTCFAILTCFGQQVILKGIIIDAATGEPISYASVSLRKNGIMAMSNEQGRFIFKIPANDSVFITCIGYTAKTVLIDTTFKVIKLEKKISALSEVVVKGINPVELIKKAIAKIPENYPTTPYVLNGF